MEIQKLTPAEKWITPSLFETFNWPKMIDFVSVVHQLRKAYYVPEAKTFLGYSLGGRIGLQWLELFPNDFERNSCSVLIWITKRR